MGNACVKTKQKSSISIGLYHRIREERKSVNAAMGEAKHSVAAIHHKVLKKRVLYVVTFELGGKRVELCLDPDGWRGVACRVNVDTIVDITGMKGGFDSFEELYRELLESV